MCGLDPVELGQQSGATALIINTLCVGYDLHLINSIYIYITIYLRINHQVFHAHIHAHKHTGEKIINSTTKQKREKQNGENFSLTLRLLSKSRRRRSSSCAAGRDKVLICTLTRGSCEKFNLFFANTRCTSDDRFGVLFSSFLFFAESRIKPQLCLSGHYVAVAVVVDVLVVSSFAPASLPSDPASADCTNRLTTANSCDSLGRRVREASVSR